jgi:hypothetical protein
MLSRRKKFGHKALASAYLVGSIAAAVLGVATGARAGWGDYGQNTNNSGVRPDDYTHSTCWNDSGSNPNEMGNAWLHFENDTALDMVWYGSDCSGVKNALYDDNLNNPGLGGLNTCSLYNGEGHCLSGQVRLNPSVVTTFDNRQSTWCHETGHSGGLGHGGTDTCMETSTGFPNPLIINAHEIAHIANLL